MSVVNIPLAENNARCWWDRDGGYGHVVGNACGKDAPGATVGHESEIAGIIALVNEDLLCGGGHIIPCDRKDAVGRRIHAQIDLLALFFDPFFSKIQVQRDLTA